jgi:predicted DNA-binding transcriptional regulator AlpA
MAPAVDALPRFVGRQELCARFGMSRSTSYRFERQGYLSPPI